jgi:hypothetical protein
MKMILNRITKALNQYYTITYVVFISIYALLFFLLYLPSVLESDTGYFFSGIYEFITMIALFFVMLFILNIPFLLLNIYGFIHFKKHRVYLGIIILLMVYFIIYFYIIVQKGVIL